MKIIYSHQIFTRQVYGGVSRYIHEISRRISKSQDAQTEVFAPLHVNAYLASNPSLLRPSIRLRKYRGGAALLGSINTTIGLAGIRRRRDIDIVHASYYPLINYKPRKSKLVVTVYDMIHELDPASFSQYDLTSKLKRRAVAAADHVICISENTRRDLLEITGIPASKTSVVYLGHSLTVATPDMEAGSCRHPFILYVGNRAGYKNFSVLLEAIADSKSLQGSYEIVCFGGGPPSESESAHVRSLNLTGRVRYVTGSDQDLSRMYSLASAFVYPSRLEGFGIPPLDAMAHGCPVICARASSIPEVAGEGAEYFDPSDSNDLIRALEKVLGSADYARALMERGRERVAVFSWDRCAAETLALYQRITRDRRE